MMRKRSNNEGSILILSPPFKEENARKYSFNLSDLIIPAEVHPVPKEAQIKLYFSSSSSKISLQPLTPKKLHPPSGRI